MIFNAQLRNRIGVLTSSLKRWDWLIYLFVSGVCILAVSSIFYSSLRLQTLYSLLWNDPAQFDSVAQQDRYGDWSAPLDDVFIHFDFARSTARGYPFQWLDRQGYSSGGTSLLYPFVPFFTHSTGRESPGPLGLSRSGWGPQWVHEK